MYYLINTVIPVSYTHLVNILLADTKDIGGVAHGQMILQLPDEAVAAEKMIQYLRDRNLEVEELKNYVG